MVVRAVLFLLLLPASTKAAGPSAADTVRAIRDAGLDPQECYRVRDLNLFKEDIRLFFNDGYLILSKPVAGERVAAVFVAAPEGGDGEVVLLPPNQAERNSLAKFTHSPNLDEHFQSALLIFTDSSGRELRDQIIQDGRGRKDPEMGARLAGQWGPQVASMADGLGLRLVGDVLSPVRSGGGFLVAAVRGKTLGSFDVLYDPLLREQILAGQLVERNQRLVYDVWTSFETRRSRAMAAKPAPPGFSLSKFRISASLDESLHLTAVTRATVKIGPNPRRAFSFEISRAEQVTAARMDGSPVELLLRESARDRAMRADENDVFLAVAPDLVAPGSVHEIEFEHQGSVIDSPGNGVYSVGARSNWYPRSGDEFATFDLTFRYPKRLTLVTAGEVVEDRTDGDWRVTARRTSVPIRVAGFNLGDYQKITSVAAGLTVDVYGNRRLDPALQPGQHADSITKVIPETPRSPRREITTTLADRPAIPDPLARMNAVAADVSASFRYYSEVFGPPPLKTLTVSPIPGTFGQGFPGLLYLSTLTYLDPNERPASARGSRSQTFFSDLMVAHEVAHQWWGNVVTAESYQDEWMLEALANYSALLWLEKNKGPKAVEEVLVGYRDDLLSNTNGRSIESAGPVTLGYRLESDSESDAWRVITYEKGAWVFHMLRRSLGDANFLKMLGELRRRYQFRAVSTADLLGLAKEFRPARVTPESLDAFFDAWVYSTGVPSLSVSYTVKGLRLSGTVEQTGVGGDFSVDVPVEIQFAKGAPQIVWVRTGRDSATFSATVRQVPVRAVIPVGTSVLAIRK